MAQAGPNEQDTREDVDAGVAKLPPINLDAGLAAGTYESIRSALMARDLLPGQRISEASISRQFGISRSPVREALASLERDGLVTRQGSVVYVRERTFEEMLDVFEVRIYLEGAIARDAAQRRTTHDLRRIESVVEFGRRLDGTDRASMTSANKRFHEAMAMAAHNATLATLQRELEAQVYTMTGATLTMPGRWAETQAEHETIAAAVEAQDADAAREAAEKHMSTARDIRIRLFEERAFSG